jgi:hypothetical protein
VRAPSQTLLNRLLTPLPVSAQSPQVISPLIANLLTDFARQYSPSAHACSLGFSTPFHFQKKYKQL